MKIINGSFFILQKEMIHINSVYTRFLKTNFTIILFVVMSCSTQHRPVAVTQSEQYEAGKIQFDLDSTQSYKTHFVKYINDKSGAFLAILNPTNSSSLSLYDWDSHSLKKTIPLIYNGPNGVGIPDGIICHGMDTIYVYSRHRNQLSLVNSDGIVKKRWDTTDRLNQSEYYAKYATHLFLHENSLCGVAMQEDISPFEQDFYAGTTFQTTNLSTNKISRKYSYPRQFYERYNNIDFAIPSCTYDEKENVILSYSLDDSLYVYHLKEDHLRKVDASSERFEYPAPMMDVINMGMEQRLEIKMLNGHYGAVLYNEYRDRYYRLFWHPMDKNSYQQVERTCDIIVLDKDFDIINKVRLAHNKYDIDCMFTHKDGLYISTMGKFNPDVIEDSFEFELLDI